MLSQSAYMPQRSFHQYIPHSDLGAVLLLLGFLISLLLPKASIHHLPPIRTAPVFSKFLSLYRSSLP
ncbi:hypothetical protein BDZ94DRAFT_1276569 [Collybia nuda]|uniref:Uncharacterized protein n=1 Tax=Collybia nuda TaxID=64659 RepID=A0A9P5XSK0_9AGAR|nr:hypothetical protein BDZ94DRAFT_1276569 [Collybia nuda]